MLLFGALACTSADDGTGSADGAGPTWYADVEPIVSQHCTRCHDGDGVAPFDFASLDTVRLMAEIMLVRIDDGEMPPPAADPDCHPYEGSDWMVLPDADRDVLAQWIDGGMPEGDPASSPGLAPIEVRTLERVDLEARSAGGWTPEFVDGNEYRCFLLGDVAEDTFVTGIEALIDNPRVSHHALFFVDPDGGSEALVTDQASGSWPCDGVQPQPEFVLTHAWAPGGGAIEFPDGMGLKVAGGSQLVVQMHYFEGEPDPRPDSPGYAFSATASAEQEMYFIGLGPTDFVIPPGDAAYTATDRIPMEWLTYGVLAFDVWGVLPHMHLLGSGYDFLLEGPDGDACISRADRYDFAMQPTYWFDSPVTATTEQTLSISCTWDNSAGNPSQVVDPPVTVTWGENTQQEMCFALMYVSARLDL
jgi:hypothetical protein